jgi:hypothetical protein
MTTCLRSQCIVTTALSCHSSRSNTVKIWSRWNKKTWAQGWFVVKIDVRSAMMPGGPTANSCRAGWRRPNHLHPLIAARRRSATPPSTHRSQCDTAGSMRYL